VTISSAFNSTRSEFDGNQRDEGKPRPSGCDNRFADEEYAKREVTNRSHGDERRHARGGEDQVMDLESMSGC
jgi:hypothetical protein